jgi:hypothetical protein
MLHPCNAHPWMHATNTHVSFQISHPTNVQQTQIGIPLTTGVPHLSKYQIHIHLTIPQNLILQHDAQTQSTSSNTHVSFQISHPTNVQQT